MTKFRYVLYFLFALFIIYLFAISSKVKIEYDDQTGGHPKSKRAVDDFYEHNENIVTIKLKQVSEITLSERDDSLKLQESYHTIIPSLTWKYLNGTTTHYDGNSKCKFYKSLTRNSETALTLCNDKFDGIVHETWDTYYYRIYPSEIIPNKIFPYQIHNIYNTNNEIFKNLDSFVEQTKNDPDTLRRYVSLLKAFSKTPKRKFEPNYYKDKEKYDPVSIWIKLGIYVDNSVIQNHGLAYVEQYILSQLNIVSSTLNMLRKNTYIVVTDIMFLAEDWDCKVTDSKEKINLNPAQSISSCIEKNKPLQFKESPDISIWITKEEMTDGISVDHYSGACISTNNIAVIYDDEFQPANSMIEAIFHMIGVADYSNLECKYKLANNGNLNQVRINWLDWLKCSKDTFNWAIKEFACFYQPPILDGETMKKLRSNIDAIWQADCQNQGDEFIPCFEGKNSCNILNCKNKTSNTCRIFALYLPNDTVCEYSKKCKNFNCVFDNSKIQQLIIKPINQDSYLTRCSEWEPIMGCQNVNGLSVITESRECELDEVAERFKVAKIISTEVKYEKCSNPKVIDMREEQCKNLVKDTYKETVMAVEMPKKILKCKLFCRETFESEIKCLNDTVADGTPCSYDQQRNDICLKGKCVKVGCDGNVGSIKVQDKCGICDGDNSQCTKVSYNFKAKITPPLIVKLTVIPEYARHLSITITQRSLQPDKEPFDLINKIKVYDKFAAENNIAYPSLVKGVKPIVYKGVKLKIQQLKKEDGIRITSKGPFTHNISFIAEIDNANAPITKFNVSVEYFLPTSTLDNERFKLEYTNKWTKCNALCGEMGMRKKITICRDTYNGNATVDRYLCFGHVNFSSLEQYQKCKRKPCYYKWFSIPIGQCKDTFCGKGFQQNRIFCGESFTGKETEVKNCIFARKPMMIQPCNKKRCTRGGTCYATCYDGKNITLERCPIKEKFASVSCQNENKICKIPNCGNYCSNQHGKCKKIGLNNRCPGDKLYRFKCCSECHRYPEYKNVRKILLTTKN